MFTGLFFLLLTPIHRARLLQFLVLRCRNACQDSESFMSYLMFTTASSPVVTEPGNRVATCQLFLPYYGSRRKRIPSHFCHKLFCCHKDLYAAEHWREELNWCLTNLVKCVHASGKFVLLYKESQKNWFCFMLVTCVHISLCVCLCGERERVCEGGRERERMRVCVCACVC